MKKRRKRNIFKYKNVKEEKIIFEHTTNTENEKKK